MSEMYKLKIKDFVGGLVSAVIAAAFVTLAGVFQTPGFDLFSADWGAILSNVVNVCSAVFMSSITKKFFTDQEGKTFGKIKI